MEWFIQLDKIEATREEVDKALTDALETRNSLLVRIALAMGANPTVGGGKLLVYASEQSNLALAQKLIPTIDLTSEEERNYFEEATTKATQSGCTQILEEIFPAAPYTMSVAMKVAVGNNMQEMAAWLLSKGAVLHIDRECIKLHLEMVKKLLSSNFEVKTNIEEEALLEIISMETGAEVLEMLLGALRRDAPENFERWLVPLAEECGEIGKIDYMKVIKEFGVYMRSVSTRYFTSKEMREFMRANGAYVCEF